MGKIETALGHVPISDNPPQQGFQTDSKKLERNVFVQQKKCGVLSFTPHFLFCLNFFFHINEVTLFVIKLILQKRQFLRRYDIKSESVL